MRHPRTRKLVSLALTLGALAGLWHFFAPTAIGGSANYVVTDGISMEPRFHSGDLAVVRSQGTYHVGEIVAYYNKEFHTIVLHRIVGRAGARYVFKGDNNNFVDFEHPAGSQLIGALWLHLPGVGGTLASIRSPALIGVLTALGTLLLAGGVFTRRRGRRRRAARAAAGEALALAAQPRGPVEWAAGLIAALTLALLAFVLLALLAFTRPPTQRLPYAVRYEQSGTLTYTAQANPGPTYANGVAVTGEPLFTHVINTAELRFAYEFHSPTPSRLDGTAWLDAQIASSSGWQTTLRLGQPTHFQGEHALVSAPLGLSALEQLVRSVQDTTGVSGADTLT
ncbi:MAG TPA: signal peptidase I, partial [Solirubrobacteraceae bacterium]|nr:signal peptidase I [Solirubrobacteraceae bacterium]